MVGITGDGQRIGQSWCGQHQAQPVDRGKAAAGMVEFDAGIERFAGHQRLGVWHWPLRWVRLSAPQVTSVDVPSGRHRRFLRR
jgi:hypothetical protein